jgi:single-strand DNA-binding protein
MARDNSVSISGNLTRDPSLKFLQSGTPVCEFGLAWNPPGKRNDRGGYDDQPPHFFDVTCWAELAEHVAESMSKGQRVTVVGNLEYRSWEKDGEKRSKVEIRADEVGPSLRWATADVTRTEKGGGGAAKAAPKQYADDSEPF